MESDIPDKKLGMSKQKLFQIFLKTGRKRVSLSIISGILIFLTITSLCMVVYKYRFRSFTELHSSVDWFNDGTISAKSTNIPNFEFVFADNILPNMTNEFSNLLTENLPGLKITDNCSAIRMQLFHYTYNPDDPWHYYQLAAPDDRIYGVLENGLIEGRMPKNQSELIYYQNEMFPFNVNDTFEIWYYLSEYSTHHTYTIVGLLGEEKLNSVLQNANLSTDIVGDYRFDTLGLYNYYKMGVFYTNFSTIYDIYYHAPYYYGYIDYLVDFKYNLNNFELRKIKDYLRAYQTDFIFKPAAISRQNVEMASELKYFIITYNNFWTVELANIIEINSPLLIMIGLISLVTLNIGSKELDLIFRRMKLYGLSYKMMRQMIFLEDFIFTFVSFLSGTAIGILISYLISRDVSGLSDIFYIDYFKEPLLLISLGIFLVGFFLLSFIIHITIARQSTKDVHELYKKKRRKIKVLFSTNEFRSFIVALIFSFISVVLYLLYELLGTKIQAFRNYTYQVAFWMMITISIAFIAAFVFIMVARLVSWLWSLLSEKLWTNRLNMMTLSIKHMTDNKNIYQLLILGTIVFGLIILPSLSLKYSIPNHLKEEADLASGYTNLVVRRFLDPDNELDIYFENITEIANYTEVIHYKFIDDDIEYPPPFEINALGIEDPEMFAYMINPKFYDESDITIEDILALSNLTCVFFDSSYANEHHYTYNQTILSTRYSRYETEFRFINSFDYFPLTYYPSQSIFSKTDAFTIVASRDTIKEFTNNLYFSTYIGGETMKLIKPVNESVIPIIQEKLAEHNIIATTSEEFYDDFIDEINVFNYNNIMFFTILSILCLIFVGYFSGTKVYEDRIRIIEAMYRAGAKRRQILGYFCIEVFIINLIPLIIAIIASYPLIRYVADIYLNVREWYHKFEPNYPIWMVMLVIIGGLIIASIGWWIAITPLIYRYRPVKQE